ncbi:hypothetical protein [Streptomyces canus]|uniref:hypothetical protein n=1 Tax=Streptomyces canus TaxID=58343 RepID=UPI002E2CBFFF|nr:hypothetical protein [Streptomyces canus]
MWRLADACTACAAATEQAAVVPDTVLFPRRHQARRAARRRHRAARGPGDRVRVAEMLSYLAAALPCDMSAATRLIALQCALRMDSRMLVRLPVGVLRGLRLSTPYVWQELEEARWLRTLPGHRGEVVAELLDSALLSQYPSRPDRHRAADWALRAGRAARTAGEGPHVQLLSIYTSALSDPATGQGQGEIDRMQRECALEEHGVLTALDRLVATGSCAWWRACPDTGDVQWCCTSEPVMRDAGPSCAVPGRW